jgi:hypothetical protein
MPDLIFGRAEATNFLWFVAKDLFVVGQSFKR